MKNIKLTQSILPVVAIAVLALAQLPPPTEETAHVFKKENEKNIVIIEFFVYTEYL